MKTNETNIDDQFTYTPTEYITCDTRAIMAMKRFNTLMRVEVFQKEEYGPTRETNIKQAIKDADDLINALGYKIISLYHT